MRDLQTIMNDFDEIKLHKPMASKKLETLGKLISEAYVIDRNAAIDMWKFLLQYNDTDNEKVEEFYTVRVFRKVALQLKNHQSVDLLIGIPEIVEAYKKYHGTSWYCCGELMDSFLKENHVDLACNIFQNFLSVSQENVYINCIDLFTKSYFSGEYISNEKERSDLLNHLDMLSSETDDRYIISIILLVRFCLMTENELQTINSKVVIGEIVGNLSQIESADTITKLLDFAIQKLGLNRVMYFWEQLAIALPEQQPLLPAEYAYRNKWECCLQLVESIILSQYYTSSIYTELPIAVDILVAMLAKRKYNFALEILNNSIVKDKKGSLLLNFLNWFERYPFYASRVSVNYNYPFELSETQIGKIVSMLKRLNPYSNRELIEKINDTLYVLGCEETFELPKSIEYAAPKENPISLDKAIPFIKNSIKKYGDEFGNNSPSYEKVIQSVGRNSFENKSYFENWCYLICNDFDIAEFIFKNRFGEISAYAIIKHLILSKNVSKAESLIKEHMEPLKNKVTDFERQNRWEYKLLFDLVYENSNDEKETFELYNFANNMHVVIYGFEDNYISSKLRGHKFYKTTDDLNRIYSTIQFSFNYILSQKELEKNEEVYKGFEYGGFLANHKNYELLPAFLSELFQNTEKMNNFEFNIFYKREICRMTRLFLENFDASNLSNEKINQILSSCVLFSTIGTATCLYRITINNLEFDLNSFLENVLINCSRKRLSDLLVDVFELHTCADGFEFDGQTLLRHLYNWVKFSKYVNYCWDNQRYLSQEDDWISSILDEIYDESEINKKVILDKLKLLISNEKYENALEALEGEV